MEVTKQQKDEIEKQIVEVCIGALESNNLSEEQMGNISFFVLERIDLIKTQDELGQFLFLLASKWPIFQGLSDILEGKKRQQAEKRQVENAEELIKQGKLDDALSTIKEVI